MKDVKINITPTGFPSQFVSDSEKKSFDFGLQIGQAIQYEWFRKDGGQSRFYNQWADFHRLRLYARGEQSVSKYKNEAEIGNTSPEILEILVTNYDKSNAEHRVALRRYLG